MTVKEFKNQLNQTILPKFVALTHILNYDDDTYEIQVRSVSTGETQVIFDVWDDFSMVSKLKIVGSINFYDLHNVMEAVRKIVERGE